MPAEQLLWSFVHRPYVTAFLVFFLALSWLEQGGRRTALWVVTSYLVAFAAEWGSINHGIPFGVYVYHYDALQNDLVVLGVPFFDTLSFAFLSYVSFSFAQFFLSPLSVRGLDLRRATPPQVRGSWAALLLGSFLMTVVDLIVDPIANLGKYWFLGDIYHYPDPGIHFGVTFANYCGWFVVAATTIAINQRLDAALARRGHPPPDAASWPGLGGFAPCFWAGIVLFQLGVTWWVAYSGQPGLDAARVQLQAVTGSYILAPVLVLAAARLANPGPGPGSAG
ncbi:carotenoid biosynthesis protein [Methylomagnum ishizawai]|uniref:carotenoid biosynthesis protein n=1 Tax=Methylomagnum ishizawai TaxID=1760988 RepID=UPI001C337BDC|nr:carotenoid biosynthesis protein [Methylomagnum ishizawai]BBL73812.1 membrane protein [Methylomagnum ishizawai]